MLRRSGTVPLSRGYELSTKGNHPGAFYHEGPQGARPRRPEPCP
jgi:hypothetical protein